MQTPSSSISETNQVLLVEDNPADAALIESYLYSGAADDTDKWLIHHVSSYSKAEKYLNTNIPDIVLLDLDLPDSFGLNTLHRIRLCNEQVPIVVLTGNQEQDTALIALQHNAQDFLEKDTIDQSQLERSLRYAKERSRLSARLHESESQFRSIVSHIAEGILLVDSEGKVLFRNHASEKLLERHDEAYWSNVRFSTTRRDRTFNIIGANNLVISIDARCRQVKWKNQPATLISLRDSTQEKMLEQQRYELIQNQERALKARDHFISIASHELRTPVTAMNLLLQSIDDILQQNPHLDITLTPEYNGLGRSVQRMTRLIHRLLDLSRITEGQMHLAKTRCDLSELARNIASQQSATLKKYDCSLELCLPESPLIGHWDPQRIEQVMVNILDNAAKYGSGKPIRMSIQQSAQTASIVIKDHGPGLSQQEINRIFGQFERLSPTSITDGLGVGLWIVKNIVDLHHGKIEVKSEHAEGCEFIIHLPILAQGDDSKTLN